MSKFTLDNLYGQYDQVAGAIGNLQARKAEILEKIERLETAKSNLQSNNSHAGEALDRIVNIEIDTSLWRGTEKDKFVDQKSSYEGNVTAFRTDIDRACDDIQAKIDELKEELARVEAQIAHMESIKSNILSDIDSRRNE